MEVNNELKEILPPSKTALLICDVPDDFNFVRA
jgi:hypothetical protein